MEDWKSQNFKNIGEIWDDNQVIYFAGGENNLVHIAFLI